MPTEVPVINSRQFATRFALRPNQFAWFLGAGASAASGIPTAYMMIRDFKKRIFCREANLSVTEIDASDPIWAERIVLFLQQRGLIAATDNEYSAAFEALYPNEADRRLYIEEQIRLGVPTFAHRVLAAFVCAKLTPAIFTTNFDPLQENAITVARDLLPAAERVMAVVAALDSKTRASQALTENRWPIFAKIHGDYQSRLLKNTDAELREQDADLRRVLTSTCERFGLIVVGYSGRDDSVMQALQGVLRNPSAYPAGLFWVTRNPAAVLPAVRTLMENVHLAGGEASFVVCDTFDEFAGDLQRQTDLPSVLQSHVQGYRLRERLEDAPLPTEAFSRLPVLRCSALPILSMPQVARKIRLTQALTTREVRDLLRQNKVSAVVAAVGSELAAFGTDKKLLEVLAPYGAVDAGTIQLEPGEDSWALGLLYEALARALARKRPLLERHRKGTHSLVVSRERSTSDPEWLEARREMLAGLTKAYSGVALTGKATKQGFPFSEGIELKLERCLGRWWCGFNPFTHVDLPKRPDEIAP